MSDHVPFSSYEMQCFAESRGIKLTHSSPGYPQSNGLAERTVKTVKYAHKKAVETNTDPHLALRNTPVTGMEFSLAQILMGRVLRSTLPCSSSMLRPSIPQGVHTTLQHLQERQQHFYNRGAQPLPELQPGDTVNMHTPRSWQPATITAKREEPRSYTVVSSSGHRFRRNRRHLRKARHSGNVDISGDFPESEPPSEPSAAQALNNKSPALSPAPNTAPRTRSGRAIRPPVRFQDFELGRR